MKESLQKMGENIKGFFGGLTSTPEGRKRLVLIISLVFAAGVMVWGGLTVGRKYLGGGSSPEEVRSILRNYIGQTLPDASSSVKKVEPVEGESLYRVDLEIEGKTYTSFVTKSGNLLFPTGISLEEYK